MIMQVVLTPTHLAIVMEYAAGGELFERICNAGRFSEDEVLLLLQGSPSFHFFLELSVENFDSDIGFQFPCFFRLDISFSS